MFKSTDSEKTFVITQGPLENCVLNVEDFENYYFARENVKVYNDEVNINFGDIDVCLSYYPGDISAKDAEGNEIDINSISPLTYQGKTWHFLQNQKTKILCVDENGKNVLWFRSGCDEMKMYVPFSESLTVNDDIYQNVNPVAIVSIQYPNDLYQEFRICFKKSKHEKMGIVFTKFFKNLTLFQWFKNPEDDAVIYTSYGINFKKNLLRVFTNVVCKNSFEKILPSPSSLQYLFDLKDLDIHKKEIYNLYSQGQKYNEFIDNKNRTNIDFVINSIC